MRPLTYSLLQLLFLAGVTPAASALQQQPAEPGAVAGTVIAEGTLRPLAGVQVSAGAGHTAITDPAGRFRITGLAEGQVTLTAHIIGYVRLTRTVAVGDTRVSFTLNEAPIELNAVVVTGTAGVQTKRAIGNVVPTINASDVTAVAPVSDIQSLINGRAPGVEILPGSGQAGTGSKVRVRGISSLSLSNNPLLYVDGVRVDNNQSTGPTVQAFGSQVVSRLNDYDLSDVQKIEVIEGPAAATLYGTEAASGVISIITKRGSVGAPSWELTARQGSEWFMNPQGRFPLNYWMDTLGTVHSIDYNALVQQNGGPIFSNGYTQGYSLNVSGGTPVVRYYVSGNFDHNNGVEPNNIFRRYGGRANVSVAPNDKIDFSLNVGFNKARTDLSLEAGGGGAMWETLFSTPQNLGTTAKGFRDYPPGINYVAISDWQDVNRFTGSVEINHRPTHWFTQRLVVGTDVTHEVNVEFVPHLVDSLKQYFDPTTASGYRDQGGRDPTTSTVDYNASVNLPVTGGLRSITSAGGQYYHWLRDSTETYGENFPASGLSAVSSAARTVAGEDLIENNTLGGYVQEQLAWNDRLFVTGAVRVDRNSAFGTKVRHQVYPKVSGSWVISEEPWWHLHWLDQVRLRGAFGESGKQPDNFAALQTYAAATGPGDRGVLTPQFVGNANLGPEVSRGTELGFEASALDDRVGADFTYYHQTTHDAILAKDVPPSGGFPNTVFVNAGTVRNLGIELHVRGQPVRTSDLTWDVNWNIATNANKVLDLGQPAGDCASDSLAQVHKDCSIVIGSQQHRVGYPAASFFREKVVSAQLDANGRAILSTVMCDGGPAFHNQPVPCYDASGNLIAPRVFLGQSTPKTEGGISSTLTFRGRLRLYVLVDYKFGFRKTDNNLRARCQVFETCLENIYPQRYDPALVAGIQSPGSLVNWVFNDAGYAKLRELSLSYQLPDELAAHFGARRASVSLAGRNLHTWTNWTGLDPEALFLGTGFGQHTVFEQDQLPQLAQFVATINVGF